MKNYIYKIVFIICILFVFAKPMYPQQAEDWRIVFDGYKIGKQFGEKVRVYPMEIASIGSNKLILFGYLSGGSVNNSFIVLLSQNKGENWSNNLFLKHSIYDSGDKVIRTLQVFQDSIIYLHLDSLETRGYDNMGNPLDYYLSMIYKTTNFGKTWKKTIISKKWRFRRPSVTMSMYDKNTGVMAQYPGKDETKDLLWFTDDGWETWKILNIPDDLIGTFNMKMFPNNRIYIKNLGGFVYISKDIDKSWEKLDVLPQEHKESVISKTIFYNDSTFYYLGTSYKYVGDPDIFAYLFRTENRGKSWDTLMLKRYIGINIHDICIRDRNNIIAIGDSIYRTKDGFKTWTSSLRYADCNVGSVYRFIHINDTLEYGTSGAYIFKHTVGKVLVPPVFIAPKKIYGEDLDFTLKWTPVKGAEKYHLKIVETRGHIFGEPENTPSPNFDSTLFANDSLLTGTSFKLTGTKYYKTYFCRIRAIGKTQKSVWTQQRWVTKKDPSGVVELMQDDDFNITPNPATDYIDIAVAGNRTLKDAVKVYDVLGNIVLSSPACSAGTPSEGGHIRINVSGLAAGVYFVRVGGKMYKFVKI